MKSSGLNIKDTNVCSIERNGCLAASVWVYLIGRHKDMNIRKIRMLKHGHRTKSLILYGREDIADVHNQPRRPDNFNVSNIIVMPLNKEI